MDFEVASSQGTVSFLQRGPVPAPGSPATAADWFSRGELLEAEDKPAAEKAYREALGLAPDHAYAYLNLGALLCETQRCEEAIDLYDQAIRHCPDAPLLYFNRSIALEDQGHEQEALQGYERCLELAPELADAHYNAARLHEKLGHVQGALRHYSAYRRLQQ